MALKLNKKILLLRSNSIKVIDKNFDANKPLSQYSKNFFKYKYNDKKSIKIIDKYVKTRILGKFFGAGSVRSRDSKLAYANKKINTKNKLIDFLKIKKKYKKICLLAPNAFGDMNTNENKTIFSSYFEFFKKTIDALALSSNNYLWLVRPHPAAKKWGEIGVIEKYINKFKSKNIKIVPANLISTKAILELVDTVVSVNGTIAIELAALGKRPIIAANCFYSKLGFVYESKNKKDYLSIINNLKKLKKLKKNEILIAKKILYWDQIGWEFSEYNPIFYSTARLNNCIKKILMMNKKEITEVEKSYKQLIKKYI